MFVSNSFAYSEQQYYTDTTPTDFYLFFSKASLLELCVFSCNERYSLPIHCLESLGLSTQSAIEYVQKVRLFFCELNLVHGFVIQGENVFSTPSPPRYTLQNCLKKLGWKCISQPASQPTNQETCPIVLFILIVFDAGAACLPWLGIPIGLFINYLEYDISYMD